jgi:Tfp pilus assembly protein PilN
MLKGFIKHRPRNLLALYIEPNQIEVLRAHRQWRTWHIDSTERFSIPDGEPIHDFLQRLNLRPRGKSANALVLFLSRSYYTFHREHYPAALQEQLEETLNFDWHENVFHEHDRTLHFFGPGVPVDHQISVPIFSVQTDVYEKFHQVLGGGIYETFTVIPSALMYKAFFQTLGTNEDELPLEIMGRIIDPEHLEMHRFYKGHLLDSTVIGKNWDNLRLFQESLHCLGEGACQEEVHVHLLCSNGECTDAEIYGREWKEEKLPMRVHAVDESLIHHWVRYLLEQEQIRTFDTELVLKPWQVPKVAYPVLAIVACFAAFSLYQMYATNQLVENGKRLQKQVLQLETQWKPIEELQSRIAKFEQDQKTLTQFSQQGYPILEALTLLTQVTPEDTWLNYLSIKKGQLLLRGESKSAIKYLSELSKVEGLTDVRFASPVNKNPSSDMERFNVQVQIDSDKMMKTLEAMPVEKSEDQAEAVAPAPAPKPAPKPARRPVPNVEPPADDTGEDEPLPDDIQ